MFRVFLIKFLSVKQYVMFFFFSCFLSLCLVPNSYEKYCDYLLLAMQVKDHSVVRNQVKALEVSVHTSSLTHTHTHTHRRSRNMHTHTHTHTLTADIL